MTGIDAYLDRLASADPTPGGGSAATLVGALGAALCAMVARITAGNDRYVSVRAEASAIVAAADMLRERFAAARPLDEAAYERVVAASALPKDGDERKRARTAALQAALVGAAEAPLAAAGLSAEGVALAERANALGNTHLVSDVECALHFFRAALAASAANVRINHHFIKDPAIVRAQEERLVAIVDAASAALQRLLPSLP
ncbi:MAG TPA: cyclodeaminase/cyclohydrolase family protein [Candidatus Elarobacter sp.]|nr:cyclodeaminase/cyclohydrolase family protein [Candidatus Elarobacter sp.]HEV2739496.1 cyclodeaminase/cyclohydrolase family protein [Candidatus Elarobacter sp.]